MARFCHLSLVAVSWIGFCKKVSTSSRIHFLAHFQLNIPFVKYFWITVARLFYTGLCNELLTAEGFAAFRDMLSHVSVKHCSHTAI